MPPRISLPVRLRAPSVAPTPAGTASLLRAFSTTPANHTSTADQRRRRQDPYAMKQAAARKAASLSRQAVLKEQRKQDLGDPVRGTTTPFVRSFDTARSDEETDKFLESLDKFELDEYVEPKEYRNHFLQKDEMESQLKTSANLATPSDINWAHENVLGGQFSERKTKAKIEAENRNAADAIERIVNMDNGSSKDRTRANIERCIDIFGRHKTDKVLPPRAQAVSTQRAVRAQKPSTWEGAAPLNPEAYTRAGVDTGSSEVQIAILTAKIRTLADYLETRGKNDKVNKRNLRLLVHRRQKLLRYLQKKERGGPRWQNLIDKLGLTEGTWKGEISL